MKTLDARYKELMRGRIVPSPKAQRIRNEIEMLRKEVEALDREYAEECTNPSGFSKATYEEMVEERAENVTYVLRWLLRRFCLVEKADAERFYQEAKERYLNPDDEVEKTMYGGRMSLLESLFSEIAKEVEE